jgi:hypothetical protein
MDIIQLKVRLTSDLRDWSQIELWTETRPLNEKEQRALMRDLRTWSETKFVKCVRWNVKGSDNGIYFNNRNSGSLELNHDEN